VIFTQTNFEEAVWSAVTHSGLGPVSPNTVLMSWMADWSRRGWQSSSIGMTQESTSFENGNVHTCNANEFVNTLKGLGNMQRAVCILKGTSFPQAGDIMPIGSTIDIYWIVDDGGLCLLLSYIISRSSIWRQHASLQVFAVVCNSCDSPEMVESSLIEFLHQVRINATVHIISMDSADLANDFRAIRVGGSCPSCSPRLTIGEKFRAGKNDADDPSSSTYVNPNVDLTSAHVDSHLTYSTYSSIPEEFQKYGIGGNPHLPQRQQFLHQVNAHKLNEIIRWNSPNANLIVTHLPLSHKASKSNEYMEYVDTMFQDIENMLLVQGTGVQYLTDVA
jgi:potassium/chloride transporter 4/5/6